uniref:aprataxin and PNK-like factor n=1 Tax=Centroberyx gerrardi TaxID=166262 RepID=UPI003AABA2A0
MSGSRGFELVPVDGGGPIHLPEGETVLGRGPLLRVSDKRVSRNHGLLENRDGQLRIQPTHLNPCFGQSSLDDEPQPLVKGSWYPLHHGHFFSLLPGKYIYKVVAVGGEDGTPRNSQAFQEEEEFPNRPISPEPDIEPPPPVGRDQGRTPPPAAERDQGRTPPPEELTLAAVESNQQCEEEVNSPNRTANKGDSALSQEMEDDQNDVTPPVPKKRVLPAWMMNTVVSPKNPSSTPKAVKKGKAPAAAPAPAASSTNRGAAKQARPAASSSAEEPELSEAEETPRKKRRRRRRMSDEDREPPSRTAPTARQRRESPRAEESEESDSFNMEVEEEGKAAEASAAHRNTAAQAADVSDPENEDKKSRNGRTANRAESVGSNGGAASGAAPSGAAPSETPLRMPCPYGKDCYRKNPLHFQECSHPGDTDYEEEEETEEDDRPECPYGTDCYRKNPLHRKEYKHTKKPARSTRTAPRNPADDEDEDFGDEDSFINDDSEDVGDDSDYVPPDSDSGKEDIKGLQKEAKAFLKRRK